MSIYEEWENKSVANIIQTFYMGYISRPSILGNTMEGIIISEFYNIIMLCVGGVNALNTVNRVKIDLSGQIWLLYMENIEVLVHKLIPE